MKFLFFIIAVNLTFFSKAQTHKYRAFEYCAVILNDQNAKCNFELSNILIVLDGFDLKVYTPEIIYLKFASPEKITYDNLGRKIVSYTMEDQKTKKYLEMKFVSYKNENGVESANMVITFFEKKLTFKLREADVDD